MSLKRTRPISKINRGIVAIALIALVLIFIPPSAAAPNPPSIKWRQTYAGFQAVCVIQTADRGYAMAGTTLTSDGPTVIKTDSSGNVQWQKNLGVAVSLAQTRDSNIVVFCQNGDAIKIDADGNILSTISFGKTGIRQGVITDEGTFIAVGNSIREGQETYVWLRKIDSQSSLLWDLNYTGGFEVSSVINTVDRGCALAGNWKYNFWLARLDSNGNQEWSQNYVYGSPLDRHYAYSLARTSDGGFIVSGIGKWQSSGGMIPWLIKINSQGYEQSNLPYGQYPGESFSAIMQTASNDYFIVMPTAASIMQADSSGSELLQEQLGVYAITSPLGYPATSIISTKDCGFAVAGSTLEGAFLIKFAPQTAPQPLNAKINSPQNKAYDTSNIPLTFTVNDQAATFSYILDGQQAVAITGNTTLTNLSAGPHNITVCASDSSGQIETSETISFTVGNRFPIETVFAGVAIAVLAVVGFLFYTKKLSLSCLKKKDLKSLVKKQSLAPMKQNRMLWTLSIIGLCFILVFVQFFYPYVFYSVVSKGSNSFEVGVSYVYERDGVDQIYSEVSNVKDLGFKVIRVNLVCDTSNPSSYANTLSDVFFSAVSQLGIKVALIINGRESTNDINFYLDRWGSNLSYIQILNEPDVASSWQMGALFTDDEAGSKFEDVFATVAQHQLPAKYYTNFSPAYVARTNLPIRFSEKLDFVGFDVFMDSFLTISPNMIQFLHKITNKDVVISEFGMSTSNDAAQSDYLIKGLNLFKNMGLKGCWIVYWNGADNDYGIRGRLAEQQVGDWIAQNA
jgi:hypothetical protein